jgi:hypothetical protein
MTPADEHRKSLARDLLADLRRLDLNRWQCQPKLDPL